GINGNSSDEHMVRPDEESEDRDGYRGEGDEAISKDALAREAGNDLGDDAHRGQNHDVDGGMRIEPEQMLEQDGIAAEFGVEDAEVQRAFGGDQRESDSEDRRAQKLNDAGCIMRPDEQGQA